MTGRVNQARRERLSDSRAGRGCLDKADAVLLESSNGSGKGGKKSSRDSKEDESGCGKQKVGSVL